ncbi:MAG: DNA polymerase IV [Ktedonobacterales bacterium]
MVTLAHLPLPEHGFRRVLHCDLDCFFAAVEELDDPTLAGKPVVVGGDPERRGVVSTANYAARAFGIHSAMAAALAKRRCPRAIFLRPRFERYRELSERVMALVDEYAVVRERASIDEAYVELPPGVPGCRRAEVIARELKARVRAETGLVISVGVGRNKLIAKLASDCSKPDGCLVVRPGTEEAFLRPLPVGRLPGVGPHAQATLATAGIVTIADALTLGPEPLRQRLGRMGDWLWRLATAQDDRPVVSEHGPPKSISRERTYQRDIAAVERAAAEIRQLAERVTRDAEAERMLARTITLKIKWYDFSLTTRQRSLPSATREPAVIAEAALALLHEHIAPLLRPDHAARLLGVGLSGLRPEHDDGADAVYAHGELVQLRLFGDEPALVGIIAGSR